MPVKLMGAVPIKLGGAPSVVGGAPNEVGGVLVEAGGALVEAGGAPFKEVGWGPNRLVDGELVSNWEVELDKVPEPPKEPEGLVNRPIF